jgi:hypothetical protein
MEEIEMEYKATAKDRRTVESLLEHVADRVVCHRDGTISAKRGFFYKHGQTSEGFANKVIKTITGISLVEHFEDWNAWPKDSWFVVKFKIDRPITIEDENNEWSDCPACGVNKTQTILCPTCTDRRIKDVLGEP